MAGSIRQRGKQSWEVRAFVGKDPVTGKKQYATKTIRGDKRDAEIARLEAEKKRLEQELAKARFVVDVQGKLHALLETLSESADTDPRSTR
jgi:hypothetical protein